MLGEFRKFKKEDYYGYSGVSHLPNGEEPILYDTDDYTIILSGTDSETSVLIFIEDESGIYMKEFDTQKIGELVVGAIQESLKDSVKIAEIAKQYALFSSIIR